MLALVSASSTATQTVTAQLPQRPPPVVSTSRKSATSCHIPSSSSPPSLHRHQTAPVHTSRQSSLSHHSSLQSYQPQPLQQQQQPQPPHQQQQQQQQQRPPQPTPTQPPPRPATPITTTPTITASSSSSPSSVDIHTYPTTDLLKLLASLLTQIASTNDQLTNSSVTSTSSTAPIYADQDTPIWQSLTTASRSAISTPASTLTFHARNIPTITLEAYFLRILKYCPTTNEVFLALLVYFDRMSKLSADATGRTFVIDSYNIHRLVIAGVTVASKFFSDVFYTNSRYAKVGGLPLPELNQLELQFLLLNDFRLVISSDEMQRYAEQLILFSRSSGVMGGATSGAIVDGAVAAENQSGASGGPAAPPSINGATGSGANTSASSSSSSSVTNGRGNGVAAPMSAMGAIDAYGGRVADDAYRTANNSTTITTTTITTAPIARQYVQSHSDMQQEAPATTAPTIQQQQQKQQQQQRATAGEEEDDTETETEVGEDDCDEASSTNTTDDEPTIRAASVADRARRRESIDEVMAGEVERIRGGSVEDEHMGSP